ncbi:MAG TPA: hypothetical protein PKD28_02150 [Candidatus Saccharibacteria bacterium]|nr:hypothetical protein [Candidatus Saccharibacteria bacterium]
MKVFEIDGRAFKDYEGFVRELYQQFNTTFPVSGLDRLDDVLYGGVIGFEEGEEVTIIWKNNQKSKKRLNRDKSIILDDSAGGLYRVIIDMIREHDNIHLQLDDVDI